MKARKRLSDTEIANAATEAALCEMFGKRWRDDQSKAEAKLYVADMHRALKAGLRVMLREISRGSR